MNPNDIRELVGRLSEQAADTIYAWVYTYMPSPDQLNGVLDAVLGPYFEEAALLAADWYNDAGPVGFHGKPLPGIPAQRLAATAEWVYAGPQKPEVRAAAAAGAMVFDAARNTVRENARIEGVKVARDERADACGDCALAATSSGRGTAADAVDSVFHHNCDGLLVPVRRGVYEPPEWVTGWGNVIDAARRAGITDRAEIAKLLEAG